MAVALLKFLGAEQKKVGSSISEKKNITLKL